MIFRIMSSSSSNICRRSWLSLNQNSRRILFPNAEGGTITPTTTRAGSFLLNSHHNNASDYDITNQQQIRYVHQVATGMHKQQCEKYYICTNLQIRRSLSSSVAKPEPFPSNLKIDPRSSFAPVLFDDDEEDSLDDEGDEQLFVPRDYDDDTQYVIPLPERLHVGIYNFASSTDASLSAAAVDEKENDSTEQQLQTLTTDSTSSSAEDAVGTIWLDDTVFGIDDIRVDIIKRAVHYYRSKKRGKRKAKTKTISEVSGSGRKVRKQKGTGMARAGHSRPPHWRGGAKAHGPKGSIQDYGNTKLNKKVRKMAIRNVLSQKLKEGNLIIINQFYDLQTHKTKELVKILSNWNIAGRYGTTAFILDRYYPEKEDDDDSENNDIQNAKATSFAGVPINLWVASGNIHKIKVGNDLQANVYDILKYEKLILSLSALEAIENRLKL